MKITILTMFPQLFDSFREGPVVQRAIRKGSLELSVVDIKEFAPGSFRHIDDSPFGGGAGMVMRCQPVLDALRSVRGSAESGSDVSPQGSAADADAANTAQPDVVRMNEKTASGTIAAALSPAGRQVHFRAMRKTQPAVYEGEAVPEVLLSGNHARIRRWRLKESLRRTMERRPDLLEGRQFTEEEITLLEEIKKDAL